MCSSCKEESVTIWHQYPEGYFLSRSTRITAASSARSPSPGATASENTERDTQSSLLPSNPAKTMSVIVNESNLVQKVSARHRKYYAESLVVLVEKHRPREEILVRLALHQNSVLRGSFGAAGNSAQKFDPRSRPCTKVRHKRAARGKGETRRPFLPTTPGELRILAQGAAGRDRKTHRPRCRARLSTRKRGTAILNHKFSGYIFLERGGYPDGCNYGSSG